MPQVERLHLGSQDCASPDVAGLTEPRAGVKVVLLFACWPESWEWTSVWSKDCWAQVPRLALTSLCLDGLLGLCLSHRYTVVPVGWPCPPGRAVPALWP